ncbi:DUF4198 domain-containing protein [Xanthobacter sp. TB0139]|uniref:DUF4198 domain-containing protein n=1 Tax=Xanthobacter sp. TB0139 TaxID=3459178 RepID=UPI00403A6FD1
MLFRKMMKAGASVFALGAALVCAPHMASAHFQLVYVTDANLEKPGNVPVQLIFWHPFELGPVMAMGEPQEFYAVHRGKKIDLKPSLKAFSFRAGESEAQAWEGVLPVKRPGDYVLVAVPEPYLEGSEDIYIQQIAKSYVNLRQLPTDWSEPQGLVTEIVPLNRPTNIIAGSTFTGRVLSEGKPVPGVEVEVEYMAAEPVPGEKKAAEPKAAPMPGGAVVAITNANGEFTFGVPKAGYWGFAALGSGPKKTHDGKELSQDAVIWVRADEIPQP